MFYSQELLSLRQKGKLARCWLAATVNDRIFKQMCKSSTVNRINLCELCMEIMNTVQIESNETSRRFSLYLSSQLMYGAAKILLYQTTSLQTQVFQINKKVLYHKKTEIDERNTVIKDLDLCNITSVIQNLNDVQLDNASSVVRDEFNINTKIEAMMHDATCLDFGALTHEQLNFLLPNGEDISLEIFERIHITDSNLDRELSDTSTVNKIILPGLEESDVSKHELETEMLFSDRDDLIIANKEHHAAYMKTMLPEITMQEFMPGESTFLTPRKRQSTEEAYIETPTKRRHLRFEDIAVPSNAEITMIPKTEEISVFTTDYSIESLQNLESIHEDLQQIKRKSKKKRMFTDKITKLGHKVIRKCINNVNAHTVPLKVIDVNISTSEILFQEAPARFVSTRKNKWNSPLNKLFDMYTLLSSTKKEIHMESGQSLEKSTEFLRLMDKSNKTEELPSDLSSAIGRSIEISKNISSEKSVAISINELPKVIKFHDAMELTNYEPEKFQSPEITDKLFIPDASTDSSSIPSCFLTRQELLALLEIIWQNNEFAAFTDLISPDHYSKLDASFCFTFLLEYFQTCGHNFRMSDLNNIFISKKTGKYSKCWLAAMLSTKKFQRKFKSQTINEMNVSELCDDIKDTIMTTNIRQSSKAILYLSFQLIYGATKIHSYQVSNLEKDLIELEKKLNRTSDKKDNENDEHDSLNVLTPCSKQLHENFKLLPHEQSIDTKLRNLMHEAECLKFGALTEQELNVLNRPYEEISAEMFERIQITDTNDTSLYYANTLLESEEFYVPHEKAEKEMILQVRDEFIMDDEEYYAALSKMTLPEITADEFVPEESTHLTTRKRQPAVQEQIERPTKKRRLKFEDIVVPSNVEITLPEIEEAPVFLKPIVESLQDLESISVNSQQSRSKSKKVRIFADKNTQLSHKIIRKCINNINVHTVSLNIINVNKSTSEILFQGAPARFLSIRRKKWNSPLNKLFDMYTLLSGTRMDTQIESTETMRLETKSNQINELSELSGLIPESKKSMKEISADEIGVSQQEIAISEIAHQTNIQHIEQDFEMLNIVEREKIPDVIMYEEGIDQPPEILKHKNSRLTKTELLAFLEVLWRDSEMVKFTDLISPECYGKLDATRSFFLLLELHQEKKITLEQATPYDMLWIKKYYNNDSD